MCRKFQFPSGVKTKSSCPLATNISTLYNGKKKSSSDLESPMQKLSAWICKCVCILQRDEELQWLLILLLILYVNSVVIIFLSPSMYKCSKSTVLQQCIRVYYAIIKNCHTLSRWKSCCDGCEIVSHKTYIKTIVCLYTLSQIFQGNCTWLLKTISLTYFIGSCKV